MLKRFYQFVAWLAVANMFAAGGLIAYLVGTGRLNAKRAEEIAIVMRGEFPSTQPTTTSQPVEVAKKEEDKPQTSREELARLVEKKQFYDLISERQQRELDDRKTLNQSIQMDVNRQLEQIQQTQQKFEDVKQKTQAALSQEGFQQSLSMISDMEPKLAKDVLITRKDADVVQLLMKMDNGPRKKIVNACKTPEERAWVSRILTAMRALDTQVPPADAGKGNAAAQ